MKDQKSGKFYYYKKNAEPKRTQWETPLPFLEEGKAKNVQEIAATTNVVVSAAVVAAAGGKCSQYDVQEGLDIRGNDISSVHGETVEICCAECASHPLCESFTFATDTCWLKTSRIGIGSGQSKNGVTSGFKKSS